MEIATPPGVTLTLNPSPIKGEGKKKSDITGDGPQ